MSGQRDIVSAMREPNESLGRDVIAVIGIDRYAHWPRLGNAVSDARGVATLFEQLGFEQITKPLIDERATSKAVQELVNDELRVLGPNDSLVVFYAGHGSTRTDRLGSQTVKTGYLIPADASDRSASWIELAGWLRALSLLPPRHILVILDACYSGIALGPIIKWRDSGTWKDTPVCTLRSRRSRRIITSALDDQAALDSGPVHGHSLFTGCLIEGLTHGIARAGQQETTGSELALYVQHRVTTYPSSKQTPDFGTFDFDERGELTIPLAIDRHERASSLPDTVRADEVTLAPKGTLPLPLETSESIEGIVSDTLVTLSLAAISTAEVHSNDIQECAADAFQSPPNSRLDDTAPALVSSPEPAADSEPGLGHSLAGATLTNDAARTVLKRPDRFTRARMSLRRIRWFRASATGNAISILTILAFMAPSLILMLIPSDPHASKSVSSSASGPSSDKRPWSPPEAPRQSPSDSEGSAHGHGETVSERLNVARAVLVALLKERTDAGCSVLESPQEYHGDRYTSYKSGGSNRCFARVFVSTASTERLQLSFTSPLGEPLAAPPPSASVEITHCPQLVGDYAVVVRPATDAPYVTALLDCKGSTMAVHGPSSAAADAARKTLAARVQSRRCAGCEVVEGSGAPQPVMGKVDWTTTVKEIGDCIEDLIESSAPDNPVGVTVTDPVGQLLPTNDPASSLTVRYCPARTGEYVHESRPRSDAPYAIATLTCPRHAHEPRR